MLLNLLMKFEITSILIPNPFSKVFAISSFGSNRLRMEVEIVVVEHEKNPTGESKRIQKPESETDRSR